MGDQKIITLQEIFYDLYFQISYSFLRPWPRICCNYHPPDTNESSALMSDRLLRVQMLHIVCHEGWVTWAHYTGVSGDLCPGQCRDNSS